MNTWEHESSSSLSKFIISDGSCFFCSKLENVGEVKEENYNFFRLILRYLQISPWRKCNQNESKKFKVELCHKCQGILQQFGEFYMIYEETILHLNTCISKIHEAMKGPKEWDMFKREPENDLQNSDMTFREEMMLKCEEKVRCAPPRVRLKRVPNLKRKLPSTSPSPSPKFQVKSEPCLQDEDETSEEVLEDLHDPPTSPPPPSLPVSAVSDPDETLEQEGNKKLFALSINSQSDSKEEVEESCRLRNSGPTSPSKTKTAMEYPKQLPCPYCPKKYEGIMRVQRLDLHFVSRHRSHFFPNLRKENVTQDEFSNMIDHVLQLHIKEDNCSLCETSYQNRQIFYRQLYTKKHLLQNHLETLEKALVQVQDNHKHNPFTFSQVIKRGRPKLKPSIEALILPEYESRNRESVANGMRQILCQYCGQKFEGNRKLEKFRTHLTTFHLEHYFPNVQKEKVTKTEFIDMIKHVMNLCIKEDNCSLCPKLYTIKHKAMQILTVKLHLLQDHRRTLEKALVKVQDNPGLRDEIFDIEEDEEDKKNRPPCVGMGSTVKCQHCRQKFKGPMKAISLEIHTVNRHTETFFPDMRKDHVTKCEFVKIIDEVLLRHIENGNCSLCPTLVFRSLPRVKRHLIQKHRGSLEKVLVEVQENSDFQNDIEVDESCTASHKGIPRSVHR